MVRPRRAPRRFQLASRFTLLLLVLGASVFGVVQSSAALDLVPARASTAEAADENAHWRGAVHDVPPSEVSALEPEANEEPAAPDEVSVIRPAFGCASPVASAEQASWIVVTSHVARCAPSTVLARAPPERAR